MSVPAIFSRKWILFTFLVVAGMGLLVRLGFWQLDRLEQKRAFNTMMAERWRTDPFDLNTQSFPEDLTEMEYRRVEAQGRFDYENQILLSNQVLQGGTAGYVIVTPLVLDEGRAVLVARGWLPADMAAPQQLAELTEPAGAPVLGLARKSQAAPGGGVSTPVATPQAQWYRIDISALQGQMPYQLESAFLEQLPEAGRTYDMLPIRSEPRPLDDGNHLSYAIQWFTFAAVLGFGYIMFVRQRTRLAAKPMEPSASTLPTAELEEPILAGDQAHPVH